MHVDITMYSLYILYTVYSQPGMNHLKMGLADHHMHQIQSANPCVLLIFARVQVNYSISEARINVIWG